MNRSHIAVCFLLALPLATSCALDDETAIDGASPDELSAESTDPAPQRQGILGSDACRNTDIFITNSRTRNGINTAIEVRKVEYYSASEGNWYTEDLGDTMLNFGTQGIWWDEDLAYAENDLITKWRVYYRYLDGGSWSSVVYQEIDTPDERCLADANFELTVQ